MLRQGASHASGDSKVPEGVQKAAPKGVEDALPNAGMLSFMYASTAPDCSLLVHDTGNSSTGKSHALDPNESIVPKPLQEGTLTCLPCLSKY